jgi:hypothetical protein
VGGDLVGEYAQGALHEPRRAVGVAACPAPGDISRPLDQLRLERAVAPAAEQQAEAVGDRAQPVQARATLRLAILL